MKMDLIPFGRSDIDNILRDHPERADELPFGAILLDRSGTVLKYNKAEGFHAGRSPSAVIGKPFFQDIASCALGTLLYAEFLKYHETGSANVVIDHDFDTQGVAASMRIHLKSRPDGQTCWMFIKRV